MKTGSDPIFHPRSVAVVGASEDATKTAGRPLRFLRAAGFPGAVYPVNPRRDSIQGERAWPSIDALPEVPDHAYIVAPTEAAIDAVEQCGRRGVKVATVLANGFSEIGPAGIAREERLRQIVRDTGMRVIGPSSLGVVNLHSKLLLTANAAFADMALQPGSIFVASHSGSMIGALLSRGAARGVRFAGLVSVGNEVDLGLGDICAATLDDPQVTGYLLFLETLRQGDALRRFAFAAAARGKAIVAYKLGRSQAAAQLAVSHTGALAGEDDVADAFLRDCGIARMHTLDGLIEGLPLVAKLSLSPTLPRGGGRTPRVAIVTTTGGGAAMVVDQLGVRGIDVARMVDLTLKGTEYAVMKAALDEALAADDLDLVVAVPGSSARTEPQRAVQPVIDCARSGKPLAAFVVPEAPGALALLGEAGVANFRTPEACADAIAGAFARRTPRAATAPATATANGEGRLLDELSAYELLGRLGVRHAPAEAIAATSRTTALPYPVAVKVLSAEVAHKTDAGGVVLHVAGDAQLAEAIARIRASVASSHPHVACDRLLVQSMVEGVGEALVGYQRHAQVGPIVMVAAGGVLAEIHRDRSLRLAPVDLEEARRMVREVKAFAALAGYRGSVRADLEALAVAVAALSGLATHAEVIEAEVNPLMVMPEGEGVLAVDALVRLSA